jgi:uncharacterized protein (TIGR03000 family)
MRRLHVFRALACLFCAAVLLVVAAPVGAWERIYPSDFGRYDVPPRIYGWPLDDDHASYYGGGRYKEYYSYSRGYGLANFPPPLANYNGGWVKYKYWPYPDKQLPSVYHDDASGGAAYIIVNCPPNAEIYLEGKLSEQSGPTRTFISPPLPPNQKFVYIVRASWSEGRNRREQSQEIVIQAGRQAHVQFPFGTEPQVVPLPRLLAPPGPPS